MKSHNEDLAFVITNLSVLFPECVEKFMWRVLLSFPPTKCLCCDSDFNLAISWSLFSYILHHNNKQNCPDSPEGSNNLSCTKYMFISMVKFQIKYIFDINLAAQLFMVDQYLYINDYFLHPLINHLRYILSFGNMVA